MSLGESDAKFPGQKGDAIPPSPSRENPGQVFPKSDPKAAPKASIPGSDSIHDKQPDFKVALGNPFLLTGVLDNLDHALSDVVAAIENESKSVGSSQEEGFLLDKFKGWRNELIGLRAGRAQGKPAAEASAEGGMFTD